MDRLRHRLARDDERDFVATTWKRGVLESPWLARHNLSSRQGYAVLNAAIDRGALPRAVVCVGTLPDSPNIIVTWVALSADGASLLYAYTKPRFRKQGHHKQLLASLLPAPRWLGFDPILALEGT